MPEPLMFKYPHSDDEPQALLVKATSKTRNAKTIEGIDAKIDTGADLCYLPKWLLEKLWCNPCEYPKKARVTQPGYTSNLQDVYWCSIGLQDATRTQTTLRPVRVIFYDRVEIIIIGLEWLNNIDTRYYPDNNGKCILEIKEFVLPYSFPL